MSRPFVYRVYWEDTDAGGVVYHARYLAFFERARSDWLLKHGFPQAVMRERENRVFVVRRADVHYVSPARLEDELAVTIAIEDLSAAALVFSQHMHRRADERLLATARIEAVCVTADRFVPARIPAALKQQLIIHQQEQKPEGT